MMVEVAHDAIMVSAQWIAQWTGRSKVRSKFGGVGVAGREQTIRPLHSTIQRQIGGPGRQDG